MVDKTKRRSRRQNNKQKQKQRQKRKNTRYQRKKKDLEGGIRQLVKDMFSTRTRVKVKDKQEDKELQNNYLARLKEARKLESKNVKGLKLNDLFRDVVENSENIKKIFKMLDVNPKNKDVIISNLNKLSPDIGRMTKYPKKPGYVVLYYNKANETKELEIKPSGRPIDVVLPVNFIRDNIPVKIKISTQDLKPNFEKIIERILGDKLKGCSGTGVNKELLCKLKDVLTAAGFDISKPSEEPLQNVPQQDPPAAAAPAAAPPPSAPPLAPAAPPAPPPPPRLTASTASTSPTLEYSETSRQSEITNFKDELYILLLMIMKNGINFPDYNIGQINDSDIERQLRVVYEHYIQYYEEEWFKKPIEDDIIPIEGNITFTHLLCFIKDLLKNYFSKKSEKKISLDFITDECKSVFNEDIKKNICKKFIHEYFIKPFLDYIKFNIDDFRENLKKQMTPKEKKKYIEKQLNDFLNYSEKNNRYKIFFQKLEDFKSFYIVENNEEIKIGQVEITQNQIELKKLKTQVDNLKKEITSKYGLKDFSLKDYLTDLNSKRFFSGNKFFIDLIIYLDDEPGPVTETSSEPESGNELLFSRASDSNEYSERHRIPEAWESILEASKSTPVTQSPAPAPVPLAAPAPKKQKEKKTITLFIKVKNAIIDGLVMKELEIENPTEENIELIKIKEKMKEIMGTQNTCKDKIIEIQLENPQLDNNFSKYNFEKLKNEQGEYKIKVECKNVIVLSKYNDPKKNDLEKYEVYDSNNVHKSFSEGKRLLEESKLTEALKSYEKALYFTKIYNLPNKTINEKIADIKSQIESKNGGTIVGSGKKTKRKSRKKKPRKSVKKSVKKSIKKKRKTLRKTLRKR
jgi:hypothetical protein